MAKYLEIKNNDGFVTIDDEHRYFYENKVLGLSNEASSPHSIPTVRMWTQYSWDGVISTKYNEVGVWCCIDGGYLIERSTYLRYLAFIEPINKDMLYGIRFKKASTNPLIFVRISQTMLGQSITKSNQYNYIMIEVVSSDRTQSINSVNAYRDYFEIVEIGNNSVTTPSVVGNYGIEVFNQNSEFLWSSLINTANVIGSYNGNLAGSYTVSWDTSKIIVPNSNFGKLEFGWSSRKAWSYLEKDFFTFDGQNLKNQILTLGGRRAETDTDSIVAWDCRDLGFDETGKISGVLFST